MSRLRSARSSSTGNCATSPARSSSPTSIRLRRRAPSVSARLIDLPGISNGIVELAGRNRFAKRWKILELRVHPRARPEDGILILLQTESDDVVEVRDAGPVRYPS